MPHAFRALLLPRIIYGVAGALLPVQGSELLRPELSEYAREIQQPFEIAVLGATNKEARSQ